MLKLTHIHNLLSEAVRKEVFPGAVAGIVWRGHRYILSAGYSAITPFTEPMEEHLLFDLASLTKPLALGLVFMKLLEEKNLNLDSPIGRYIELPGEISKVPLFRFLNHTSGLRAWYPFYKIENLTLQTVVNTICSLPLEYPPGTKSLYSDLNFFLLTYFVESITCKPFEVLFEEVKSFQFSKREKLLFRPLEKGIDQEEIVPTSFDEVSGRILRGLVEDENTRALGGISGVAGLFGNIFGVLSILELLLKNYHGDSSIFSSTVVKVFFEFEDPVSEFTLAFMKRGRENSAFGQGFSEKAIGHLGFTGCSFLIDSKADLIVVLLTNRVHPQRDNYEIRKFRPLFHETVANLFRR